MTALSPESLEALSEAATPAPWHAHGEAWDTQISAPDADLCEIGEHWPTGEMHEAQATAALLVALRNAVPEIISALTQNAILLARIEALEAGMRLALDGLDSIAGDRTPEFFPETSYDCARRVAKNVREAALLSPISEEAGE